MKNQFRLFIIVATMLMCAPAMGSAFGFATAFSSTNSFYACADTKPFCDEAFDFDGELNEAFFELVLNPGESATFALTANAFAFFDTPSQVPLPAGV